jgi:hypothetical protein
MEGRAESLVERPWRVVRPYPTRGVSKLERRWLELLQVGEVACRGAVCCGVQLEEDLVDARRK